MKTKITLLLLLGITISAFSQFKQKDGNLSSLKGQEKIMIEFQYADDLIVNKKSEQDYIAKLKKKGGDEAETMWNESKNLYIDFFIGEMNDKLSKDNLKATKESEGVEYKIIVKTNQVTTGTHVGDLPANIKGKVFLVKIGEEDNILADFDMTQLRSDLEETSVTIGVGNMKVDVTKLKKTEYYDRMSKAYGIGGKRFANKIKKALKS